MLENVLAKIKDVVIRHQVQEVLREQLALKDLQLEKLRAENDALQQTAREAVEKAQQLQLQLDKHTTPAAFEEFAGLLFRRGPDGKLKEHPFCPCCKNRLGSVDLGVPFFCRCGFNTHLCPMDIPPLIAKR